MITCPYCKTEFDEQLNFCANCEKQVRCLSCGKPLFPGKTRCLICGASVAVAASISPKFNEYLLEEEISDGSSKRKIHLKMSDTAIGAVGEHLDRYLQPWSQPEIMTKPQVRTPALPALEAGTTISKTDETTVSPVSSSGTTEAADKYAWADDYIVKVDDQIDIKITDFKGKTKTEQQRRFVLLFVWGYQRHFDVPVPDRKPIIRMAKRLNVWNTSFSDCVTHMERDLLIKNTVGLMLAPGAVKEVNQILDDLQKTELKGHTSSNRPNKKSSDKTPKENSVEALLQDWTSKDIDLAGFDVRELQKANARQKVEFGLWILKVKLGVEKARLGVVISFVTQKYPTIGGNVGTLQNAARDKKYIVRTLQGECVLTHKGEEDIEALLPESLKASKASGTK